MSRLFIEIYLDEDVDVLIAQLLHARGFVVVTTQEVGNSVTAMQSSWRMRSVSTKPCVPAIV
jgi:hypothetical protein